MRLLGIFVLVLTSATGFFCFGRTAAVRPPITIYYTDRSAIPCQAYSILMPVSDEVTRGIQEQNSSGGRALQVGLERTLDQPLTIDGARIPAHQWTVESDGSSSYAVTVVSAGALGLRIHLQNIKLPSGTRLVIYDPANPQATAWILTPDMVPSSGELWSGTFFTDRVVVEAQGPAVAVPGLSVTIAEVSHLFQMPPSGPRKMVGSCYSDVSCYPAFADEARGVARISFIQGGNTYVCSGGLMAAAASGHYFLTAHHCIGNQSIASTVEFYWLYQTSDCNGPAPDLSTVPATKGGAELLATSADSDFSFLKLRAAPPSGTRELSWSQTPPANGEQVTLIHHPGGSYKRLTFGTVIGADPGFLGVQWSNGATEDGSSGAPLFNSNGDVVGQLDSGFHGPGSSCGDPTQPDQFGRLDVTYASIQKWLGGGGTGGSGGSSSGAGVNGTYTGLIYDTDAGVTPQTAGFFTVKSTSKGKLSGKIILGSGKYSFSGAFDSTGFAQARIAPRSSPTLMVTLQINPDDPTGITGSVSDGSFTSQLAGSLPATSVQPGQYTMILPGNPDSTDTPGGDSYGSISVSKTGQVRFSGVLADGTKVTQSSALSASSQWPLYVPVYRGQGLFIGWVSFGDTGDSDLSGNVTWINPGAANAKAYPAGFTWDGSVVGSSYARPARNTQAIDLSLGGSLTLTGGNLSQQVSTPIGVDSHNRIVNMGSGKMTLSFSPSTGLFHGTITHPDTGRSLPFTGVALQLQNLASGFFLQGNQSGRVYIGQGGG